MCLLNQLQVLDSDPRLDQRPGTGIEDTVRGTFFRQKHQIRLLNWCIYIFAPACLDGRYLPRVRIRQDDGGVLKSIKYLFSSRFAMASGLIPIKYAFHMPWSASRLFKFEQVLACQLLKPYQKEPNFSHWSKCRAHYESVADWEQNFFVVYTFLVKSCIRNQCRFIGRPKYVVGRTLTSSRGRYFSTLRSAHFLFDD